MRATADTSPALSFGAGIRSSGTAARQEHGMSGSLNITSATADPALLDLPWNLPLEIWP